jgi:ABC-2 type transport system permease protein
MVRLETSSGAQSVVQTVQAVVERTNNTAAAATAAAQQVAAATGGAVDAQLRQQAEQAVSAQLDKPAVTIQMVASNNSKVKQISGFEQASSGEILNFVLFALLTTATGVAWERRQGLLKRLTTVGISGRQIFAGKLMAMFSIAFLQELFLVLLGQFAFGVNYFNSPVALLVVMISLAMLAASMGVLMAAMFKSEQAVIATTVISAQLLAALAGAWFPLDITSAAFSKAAHFLPGAWVIDSLHGIILKSWGIAEVLAPMGFVWIWIAVFFGLAVWRFRPE